MACSLQRFVLLFSFLSISHLHLSHSTTAIILSVTKHTSTLQYLTNVHHGTPLVPINLVVDLNAPFIWTHCVSSHVSSSSHRPIHSRSLHCSTSKARDNKPGHANILTCGRSIENPITKATTWGNLVEDIIAVESLDESKINPIATVHQLLYYCASSSSTSFLQGLNNGTRGILGLGRARIALPSQLAMASGADRKFAVCLSSSTGGIKFGGGPYIPAISGGTDISKLLTYTPLIANKCDNTIEEEYFIKVRSIGINGRRIKTDQFGVVGAKISTIVPYTTLKSSIYRKFARAYIKAAKSMNMTRVASVAPFRICFSSKNVGETTAGPRVPIVDLGLQSEAVKWRIWGRNSMVRLSEEIMCLGFLDGGSRSGIGIVIGGYQLEDNLVEFDLGTSMLGFSSSLLTRHTSCSNLYFYSSPKLSL